MNLVTDKIFEASSYLIIAGVVYLAYKLARESARAKNGWIAIGKGFLWCSALALFAAFSLGDSSCVEYDEDIYGTHCYTYEDDGFQPSGYQRTAQFAYFMTLLYIPVLIGAKKGHSKHE